MADAEDDVIVAIEPDLFEGAVKDKAEAGETVTKVVPEKKVAAAAEKAPSQELVDQFRAEAQRERERRTAAERVAVSERQEREKIGRERDTAREEVTDRELDSINTGIAAAQTEAEAASGEYKAAFDEGNGAKMAAAQRKIARAEAKAVRLDEAKADLEARKATKAESRGEQRQEQARQASADPVEAYVQGRTEPTANWLRSHAEWVTDPRKNAKLTAAHYAAVSEGLAPDTEQYFESVETFIGLRENEAKTEAKTEAKANGAAKPRKGPPVAPVNNGGGGGGGGIEVNLSRKEAEAAIDGTHIWNYDDPSPHKRFKKGDPIGTQEFARRKLKMTAQGLYDRTYVES
jgi:hypothetical protein